MGSQSSQCCCPALTHVDGGPVADVAADSGAVNLEGRREGAQVVPVFKHKQAWEWGVSTHDGRVGACGVA